MKNIRSVLLISIFLLSGLLFISCEGPEGPIGPQGPQGFDGGIFSGATLEETITFSPANNFEDEIIITPQINEGDVILVYRLEGILDEFTPIWEALPTSIIQLDNGANLNYRFNFTRSSIIIKLESSTFDIIPIEYTDEQIFRIVVVPSELQGTDIDFNDFNSVSKSLNLKF